MEALCFAPCDALALTLVHVVNPALPGKAQMIKPPKPIEPPIPCAPIIQDDCLRGKGLFDITHPKLKIACQSVFKPSGWVQRLLTPQEFLRVFDVPAALIQQLSKDRWVRSLLLRSLSPLIMTSIFHTMWSGIGGGISQEPYQGSKVQTSSGTNLHMEGSTEVQGTRKLNTHDVVGDQGPNDQT
jgi:hypothetical protein